MKSKPLWKPNCATTISGSLRLNYERVAIKCGKYVYEINLKPIIFILRLFGIAKRIKE